MNRRTNLLCSFLLTFCGVLFGQQTQVKQDQISLLTLKKDFVVNDDVVLHFNTTSKAKFSMYATNSYGSSLVNGIKKDDKISFQLPTYITRKRGVLHWKVFNNQNIAIQGNINIKPQQRASSLEMYLGPPSIEAGGKDFSMLVTIPTDTLDNPLLENTNVAVKRQFLNDKKSATIKVNNLIAYQNIYSPLQAGRMLLATNHLQKNSVELDLTIAPAIPEKFQIFFKRNHNYADGNQITTFYTSVLKDKFNNVVSDGTLVYFFITNSKNAVLKTFGQTVNGVAKAKMIHPDKAANWSVKAFVDGIAESKAIYIKYQQAVQDFNIVFKEKNTKIQVGPFKSFMNQIIPDGLNVKLSVTKHNKVVKVYYTETKKGFSNFILNKNFYEKGNYTLKIEAAGLIKTFEKIALW
ncbi:hypothetical protein [uncultured Polaribacter sp.]|uniref:hypothetical protein n=1 Tax=uncultured Polaribacter sp. TaxID=174711 RepID=UPI002627C8CD|nr:hypothetical protein [uncultured Polaribacter sp.]